MVVPDSSVLAASRSWSGLSGAMSRSKLLAGEVFKMKNKTGKPDSLFKFDLCLADVKTNCVSTIKEAFFQEKKLTFQSSDLWSIK